MRREPHGRIALKRRTSQCRTTADLSHHQILPDRRAHPVRNDVSAGTVDHDGRTPSANPRVLDLLISPPVCASIMHYPSIDRARAGGRAFRSRRCRRSFLIKLVATLRRTPMVGTEHSLEREVGVRKPERRVTARRTEILDVASALFGSPASARRSSGFAEACDMQAGSLYHHFASKDEICRALVARSANSLAQLAVQGRVTRSRRRVPRSSRRHPAGDRHGRLPAVRNRAALLLTLCKPPGGEPSGLTELSAKGTDEVHATMAIALQRAQAGAPFTPTSTSISSPSTCRRACCVLRSARTHRHAPHPSRGPS